MNAVVQELLSMAYDQEMHGFAHAKACVEALVSNRIVDAAAAAVRADGCFKSAANLTIEADMLDNRPDPGAETENAQAA